jgi:hypothetical protein
MLPCYLVTLLLTSCTMSLYWMVPRRSSLTWPDVKPAAAACPVWASLSLNPAKQQQQQQQQRRRRRQQQQHGVPGVLLIKKSFCCLLTARMSAGDAAHACDTNHLPG